MRGGLTVSGLAGRDAEEPHQKSPQKVRVLSAGRAGSYWTLFV
jgi:hypothetical protein